MSRKGEENNKKKTMQIERMKGCNNERSAVMWRVLDENEKESFAWLELARGRFVASSCSTPHHSTRLPCAEAAADGCWVGARGKP